MLRRCSRTLKPPNSPPLVISLFRGVIFSKWLWVLDCRGAAVGGAKAPIVSKKMV